MEKREVAVVVPIYKPQFSPYEARSVRQTVAVLGHYPIILLAPVGLDLTMIHREFPSLEVREVSDEWLGRKNGIAGYNRMMLSADFYDLFRDFEYILICQPDVWIFRDELSDWCRKGYDCVAAPWVRRRVYNLPLLRQWLALRRWWCASHGRMIRQMIYGRIGNGGLSLRRVDRFREACRKYALQIEQYCALGSDLGNEDVFWALVPEEFRYPTQEEALRFAFDTNPKYCYRMCKGRLPMGCHGWFKPRRLRFWETFIQPADAACGGGTGR